MVKSRTKTRTKHNTVKSKSGNYWYTPTAYRKVLATVRKARKARK